jgi:hypothetical protein
LNNADRDNDGVPDYADGYNLNKNAGDKDDTPPAKGRFAQMV